MGFGISLEGFIGQIVNFLILLILLTVVAYKPITKMLDERSRRIKESMDQTELIREQMERSEQEVQKRLEEARKEGQAMLAQAEQVGERLKQEACEEARREVETIMARARSEIKLERDEALNQLRLQFADLAILAAEKVIKETLDKKAHRRLIEEVLEESTLKEG